MSLEIYKACCANVKEIKKRSKDIKRQINRALEKEKYYEVVTLTRVYAMLYSVFAEAAFIKMINTPHGFSEDYIKQILSQRNLESKWNKCIELAFSRINGSSGEIANKKQKINNLLNEYIIKPSELRNKIAHGQWCICLTNDCQRINTDLTQRMQSMDLMQIYVLFQIYEKYSQCIEDMIESPDRAHFRDYYSRLTDLEEYIKKTHHYSMESKLQLIKDSPKRYIASNQ